MLFRGLYKYVFLREILLFKKTKKNKNQVKCIIFPPPLPPRLSRSVGDHEGSGRGHSSDPEGIPSPGGPQYRRGPQAGLPRDHYARRCSQRHLPHLTGRRLRQIQQDHTEKRGGHHVGL